MDTRFIASLVSAKDRMDDICDADDIVTYREASRRKLAVVEDVIDHLEQHIARLLNNVREIALVGVQFGVQQQRERGEHAVHGGSNLLWATKSASISHVTRRATTYLVAHVG
jgi:hypothetical protein